MQWMETSSMSKSPLKGLNLPPSRKSTDAEFLRRVYLDTMGILPTAQEAKSFLDDQSESKRNALIEQVLQHYDKRFALVIIETEGFSIEIVYESSDPPCLNLIEFNQNLFM